MKSNLKRKSPSCPNAIDGSKFLGLYSAYLGPDSIPPHAKGDVLGKMQPFCERKALWEASIRQMSLVAQTRRCKKD